MPEFEALLISSETHTILGTQSWLNPETDSSEIFGDNLIVYQKNRAMINRGAGSWTLHLMEVWDKSDATHRKD